MSSVRSALNIRMSGMLFVQKRQNCICLGTVLFFQNGNKNSQTVQNECAINLPRKCLFPSVHVAFFYLFLKCVVPENIHTPTTEGIPPTPQDFPFSRYFLTPPPPPFGNSLNTEHTPTPLWKSFISKDRLKNQFDVNISEISRTAYRRKYALSKSARAVQFHR